MIKKLSRVVFFLIALPRWAKRGIVLALDIAFCILSVWLSLYLRLGEFVSLSGPYVWPAIASVFLAAPIFIASGLYRTIFRYSGLLATIVLTRAILLYGVVFAAIFVFHGIDGVPSTIGFIQPILLFIFLGASRVLARIWLGGAYQKNLRKVVMPRALVYGAGVAGRQLASAMLSSTEIQVVGFLDDDVRLHGHTLNGLPIHNPADLPEILTEYLVSDVLLALPSVSHRRRNEILDSLKVYKVAVRTLPGLGDLVTGRVQLSDVRDLDANDLLGRVPVSPNHSLLVRNIADKVVLVSGAGGSIGSELCRQIVAANPARILLVEQNEFALYSIYEELKAKIVGKFVDIVPLLGSVQDENRMRVIISAWHPDTVYHTAAYKHVPLVEHNTAEGVKNNVFGTLCIARVAAEMGVSNFVLVSTDKAVRPTNIMGASKRLSEMILQALSAINRETQFSMVRFGNVLDSSGSVVPKFRQQIRDGGPISLTHPDITRYFMTIPEAAQLVIQAGAMAKGGDVFVLDMGEPVKIFDLAQRMIELSGLSIKNKDDCDGDIKVVITGLRPGEKLYEELLIGGNPEPTSHPQIMKAHEDFLSWPLLIDKLNQLEESINSNDIDSIRAMLHELVVEYTPTEEVVDWVYRQNVVLSN